MKTTNESLPDNPEETSTLKLFDHLISPSSSLNADKLPLEDIAKSQNKKIDELISEIENIVASGTKINIDYHLNNIIDEESQKEIYEYFMEDAETDNIKDAFDEFEGDYSEEELRLMKIKFMSEMAN